MPDTNTRSGLVENAGGQLVCPICRTARVWPPLLHGKTPYLSVSLDLAVPAVVAEARQQADEGIEIEADFRCTDGHGFRIVITVGLDGARLTTEWEAEEER